MDPGVLRRCIERANDFNRDRSARVLHIDDADQKAVAAAELSVVFRKEQYVFEPGCYFDLSGKSLSTVRRQFSRVAKLPDIEVRPYSQSDADDCQKLLAWWKSEHRRVHKTRGGVGTSRRLLELTAQLPNHVLGGQVVALDGKIVAFSLGGALRPGFACSIERKCINDVAGLGFFQFRHFLLGLEDFELVNDGSDADRPGLRQFKRSFRPVAMHKEFRARQKQ